MPVNPDCIISQVMERAGTVSRFGIERTVQRPAVAGLDRLGERNELSKERPWQPR